MNYITNMDVIVGIPGMESDDKKSDEKNLKDGLSSREEMEKYGYGKRERIKNHSSKED